MIRQERFYFRNLVRYLSPLSLPSVSNQANKFYLMITDSTGGFTPRGVLAGKLVWYVETAETGTNGISNSGDIAGYYWNGGTSAVQGYLLSDGTSATIDPPGGGFTLASGINDKGQIVGQSDAPNFPAFLLSGGAYTGINCTDTTTPLLLAVDPDDGSVSLGAVLGGGDDRSACHTLPSDPDNEMQADLGC